MDVNLDSFLDLKKKKFQKSKKGNFLNHLFALVFKVHGYL